MVRQDEESRLLREKAAALEERVLESDARRRDADDEFAKNRRLVQLLDNYKSQLNDAQSQLDDLRNRVGDFAHLQVRPPARRAVSDSTSFCWWGLEVGGLGDGISQTT